MKKKQLVAFTRSDLATNIHSWQKGVGSQESKSAVTADGVFAGGWLFSFAYRPALKLERVLGA